MPRPRFQRLEPERAARILEVAAEHFATFGYAGASLNRILAEAGLSKGAAYYYFDGKADLFATVVERAFTEVTEQAAFAPDQLDAGSFWPAMERLYLGQIAHFHARPQAWRAAKRCASAFDDPQVGPVLQARFAPLFALGRGLLARAQALGCVRTDLPEDLLIGMLLALDQAIDAWMLAHPEVLAGAEGEALARRTLGALRRLLEPA
ncbi:MAG: TetR/AcrR family transcriptional regulator [Pseudomonadota bacterium]